MCMGMCVCGGGGVRVWGRHDVDVYAKNQCVCMCVCVCARAASLSLALALSLFVCVREAGHDAGTNIKT